MALLSSSLPVVFALATDVRLRGCFGLGAGFGEDGEAGFGESAFRKMDGEGIKTESAIWRSRFHPFATFRRTVSTYQKQLKMVRIERSQGGDMLSGNVISYPSVAPALVTTSPESGRKVDFNLLKMVGRLILVLHFQRPIRL